MSFSQPFGIKFEVDEFNGDSILTSDWVVMNDPVWKGGHFAAVKISKIEDVMALQLKATTDGNVLSVSEGDLFQIKLQNDSIVTLQCLEHSISGIGEGTYKFRASSAMGITVMFLITPEQLSALTTDKIYKARLTTSKGYLEIQPEKDGYKEEMLKYFRSFLVFSKM
jgi:hypothetical protein